MKYTRQQLANLSRQIDECAKSAKDSLGLVADAFDALRYVVEPEKKSAKPKYPVTPTEMK